MARCGTSNFRHGTEHKSWMAWDGFWREGLDRECADHPYHPWNINTTPTPTYLGARTEQNDNQLQTWHKKRMGIERPWAGKSACHSPRFHGHSGMPVTMLSLIKAKSQPDLIAHDGRNMHDSYPVDQPPSGRKAMYHGHSGGNGGGRSARSGSSTARSQSSAMISARSDNGRGGGGASRSRNFTRGERPPMALAR